VAGACSASQFTTSEEATHDAGAGGESGGFGNSNGDGGAGDDASASGGGLDASSGSGGSSASGTSTGSSGTASASDGGERSASGSDGTAGGSGTAGVSGAGGATTGMGGGIPGGTAGIPSDALFFDDFEEGPDSGWTVQSREGGAPGLWTTAGSSPDATYRSPSDANPTSWTANGDASWTDQHLQVWVRRVTEVFNGTAWLAVRMSEFELGNYYYVVFSHSSPVSLYRRVDGVPVQLASTSTTFPASLGEWHDLGISVKGSQLSVYRDGEVILTATDDTLTAGQFMLGTNLGSFDFDSVLVTVPE
jgi:hypothetical protein